MKTLGKEAWILLILKESPLDRIRIMKALFLLWYRHKEMVNDYFKFEPYLYGPCSFEVYEVLDFLLSHRMITQLPHPVQQWGVYYLTPKGQSKVDKITVNVNEKILEYIKNIVKEVAKLGFRDLLNKIYKEAPEFAINSIFRI